MVRRTFISCSKCAQVAAAACSNFLDGGEGEGGERSRSPTNSRYNASSSAEAKPHTLSESPDTAEAEAPNCAPNRSKKRDAFFKS